MGVSTEIRRSSLSAAQLCHETDEAVAVIAVPSGLLLDANKAFCDLFDGKSVEDWAEPIYSSAGKGTSALLQELLQNWSGQEDQWISRACFYRPNGRRIHGRTGFLPVPGARRRMVLLHIFRGSRSGERELRSLIDQRLEQLRSLEHLRALGEFSSVMVHEIRTPLTSLRIGLDLLPRNAGMDRKVGILIDQVDRIETFLGQVRDFAKPVALYPSLIPVRSLVGSVVERLKERFPGIHFRTGFRAQMVFADSDRLRDVLNNILLNAIESGHESGPISIRVVPVRSGIRIALKDRGKGMNSLEKKSAFQLFHTTKREGTGLGLSIVKKIMDLHGGQVSLVSFPGQGTEVRLDFPNREESSCGS